MHWSDGFFGFQGGMMMVGMVLFWGVLIFLGFYLLRNYINGGRVSSHHYVDILKERFAKGEITEEEYNQMKEKLQ